MRSNQRLDILYFGFILSNLLKEQSLSQANVLTQLNNITGKNTKRQQFNRWITGETKPEQITIKNLSSILKVNPQIFELQNQPKISENKNFTNYIKTQVSEKELKKLKRLISKTLMDLNDMYSILGISQTINDKICMDYKDLNMSYSLKVNINTNTHENK